MRFVPTILNKTCCQHSWVVRRWEKTKKRFKYSHVVSACDSCSFCNFQNQSHTRNFYFWQKSLTTVQCENTRKFTHSGVNQHKHCFYSYNFGCEKQNTTKVAYVFGIFTETAEPISKKVIVKVILTKNDSELIIFHRFSHHNCSQIWNTKNS